MMKSIKKIETKKHLYHPRNAIQNCFDRVIIVADAAHSFGATYKGKYSGEVADFTCFSFHAVKNLTTGEGGAVTWKTHLGMDNDQLYKEYQLLSLHGQNKDALAKTQLGSWEYDIVYPAYKCNMTDIMAGIGLAQIERYHELLNRRRTIIEKYNAAFQNYPVQILNHYHDDTNGSGHLYILRILGKTDSERREIIAKMAEKGIACNVHYKPLPMMTAYKNLGFDITHYPNAFDFYQNEITLPLHTLLTDDDVDYIIASLIEMIK